MGICRSILITIYSPILTFFLIVFLTVLFSSRVCTSNELLIGTGELDSFSYFAGKAICSSIKNNAKNITCHPVPSDGYASSLTNLQSGSLDMALVSSKLIYDAFTGAGFFQYINIQYDNLRLLLPFYRVPISLIVRRDAGISNLNDLVGKRVNGGALYSRQNLVFAKLMAIKNWTEDNFRVYQNISPTNAQDSLAMKSGSIQAMLHTRMHPDNSLRNLLVQNNSKLVGLIDADVNQLIDSKEGFSRCSIETEMYPGLTSDLDTLATETLLITSADTDNETVELILNALTKAKRQLQQAHPSFLQNNIGIETLNDSYLHPHPAAILFFQTNINRLP